MFEQIIAVVSLLISALTIIFSHFNTKAQLNYQFKKDNSKSRSAERDICVEFLAYCKKAYNFGLSNDDLKVFTELYIKLYLVRDEELRNSLLDYCDSIITKKENAIEKFSECVNLFSKQFKDDLII